MDNQSNKFYKSESAQKNGEIIIESLIEYESEGLMKGSFNFNEPANFRISKGTKFYDIVPLGDIFNFAISRRCMN